MGKQKIDKMSKTKIRVSYPPWAETETSWKLLTKSNKTETAWTGSKWFPKKLCSLKVSKKNNNVGILTMPKWLYKKNKL